MRRPRLTPALAIGLLSAVLAATPVSAAPPTGSWAAIPSIYPSFSAAKGVPLGVVAGPDGRMYAYGPFTDAGGDPTADYLAVYDPATRDWNGLGSNGQGNGAFNGQVNGVAFLGSKVIVVGSFTDVAGITTVDYFAIWNGSSWSTRSATGVSPFASAVIGVDVEGSAIYVAGGFLNADGVATADRVAKWDGAAWTGLVPDGALDGSLDAQAVKIDARSDGKVWVGGLFTNAATDTTASKIAYFDTATRTWHGVREAGQAGPAIANGFVYDFELVGSRIYVAGLFADVSGNPAADNVAMWTGTAWTNMGTNAANAGTGSGPIAQSASTYAVSLVPYGATMIVAGKFTDAGGNAAADCIAAWNGKSWLSLGQSNVTSGGVPLCGWGMVQGRVYTNAGAFLSVAGLADTAGIAQFGLPGGPTAPLSLAGRSGTASVSLSWAAPSNAGGSPLLDYVIQYRRVGARSWVTLNDGMKTTRTATVTRLTRGATYEFRVQAVNQWAGGAFTTPIRKVAG